MDSSKAIKDKVMKKKELDIFDILEPATIIIKEYTDMTTPFNDDNWVDNSDATIAEIAKTLPNQLTFIYSVLHEYQNLFPEEKGRPGRIQKFIYLDIMERLKNRTCRDYKLERKIQQLWKDAGGYIKKSKKKVVKND